MTTEEQYQYLRRTKKRYQKADHRECREQGHLLDEMEAYTGLHRKSPIHLMGTELEHRPRAHVPTRQRI